LQVTAVTQHGELPMRTLQLALTPSRQSRAAVSSHTVRFEHRRQAYLNRCLGLLSSTCVRHCGTVAHVTWGPCQQVCALLLLQNTRIHSAEELPNGIWYAKHTSTTQRDVTLAQTTW
jgi:hypothetical protein